MKTKSTEFEHKCERFALNQWLSEYPDDVSYEQILGRLCHNRCGEDILVWELVENESLQAVSDLIENTKYQLIRIFGE